MAVKQQKIFIESQDNILEVVSCSIDGEEYYKCDYFSSKLFTADKSKSLYNDGLVNSDKDPRKSERCGLLGETAFGSLFGLNPDFEYVTNGKPYDFVIDGLKIDVKTSVKRHSYDAALIKATSEGDFKLNLEPDLYIAAYLENENKINKTAEVIIVGGEFKENILNKYKTHPAKVSKGKWKNYELEYCKIMSIGGILEKLKNYANCKP